MKLPEIVLASGSPRRKQLLGEMGFRFRILETLADETLPEGAEPAVAAMELAARKAAEARSAEPDAVVIAADTIVAVGGRMLGKPADRAQAAEMLRMLSGRAHEVLTGLCVAYEGKLYGVCERTLVRFDEMTETDIEDYVNTGEPLDKAGAYGIQGRAGVFITGIEGCYFNVVGLPKAALKKLLIQAVGTEVYRALVGGGFGGGSPLPNS